MSLYQAFTSMRARYKLALLIIFSVIALGMVVSITFPKIYRAQSSLVLNYKGVDPVSGDAMAPQLMVGYIATQIDIVRSKKVALQVVDSLQLENHPFYRQEFKIIHNDEGTFKDWIAEQLLDGLRIAPSRESSVIQITWRGRNPEFAALVVNEFVAQYLKILVELMTDPLKSMSAYFNSQVNTLRTNLENAQQRLSSYQQVNGVVELDNQVDMEVTRLNTMSTKLIEVQEQLQAAQSRSQTAGTKGGRNSPEIFNNPLIKEQKAALVALESKIANMAVRFGPLHPAYISLVEEARNMRDKINQTTQESISSIDINARIMEQRERTLRDAVDKQKQKVLQLGTVRDRLAVLRKDVDSARLAYDGAVGKLNKASLEGQANQADVSVLSPATAPLKPWFPRWRLNAAISAVIGILLSAIVIIGLEAWRPRIRTVDDLNAAVTGPTLVEEFDWRKWNTARSRRS